MKSTSILLLVLLLTPPPSVLGQQKNRIPPKDKAIHLGNEFCTKKTNSPKNPATVCSAGTASTQSPCKVKCIAPHEAKLGHDCDPRLFRFFRRVWDDAPVSRRLWSVIIGTRVNEKNSDWEYKGPCDYYCPQMMCMNVIQHEDPTKDMQWIDFVTFDCITRNVVKENEGVCTCGHLWSLVDPVNPGRTLNNDTSMVDYKLTIGLDRKLVYDVITESCAADRFGHCSFEWPQQHRASATPCITNDPNTPDDLKIECVNRTANSRSITYRNFVTKQGLWYGVCDSRFRIEDPFGKGVRLTISRHTVILSFGSVAIIKMLMVYD